MSFYQAQVHTFDCLDSVHVAVTVRAMDDLPGPNYVVLHESTDVRGVGEQDPRQWLKDALVALIEAL
jgi:hypothetical protein